MTMKLKAISLLFLTCLFFPGESAAQSRVQRASFFNSTPFGSLAWISGAGTRAAARSRLFVTDISDASCAELPRRPLYWFMVNHLNAEQAGKVGYFSVRIIYESDQGVAAASKSGLHLYRNANWYAQNGREDTKGFERKPGYSELDVDGFMNLHKAAASEADAALAKLEEFIGPWHMRPDAESPSSWADRNLYVTPVKAALNDRVTGISARLLRFTATSSNSSDEPVLFWLSAENASAATIIVDVPNLSSEGARSSYRVMFGGTC
jgi:hypothetical protein